MENHPQVEVLWNYWPFTMVVITPFRLILNTIFFLPNIFSAPFSAFWDFFPEFLGLGGLWFISLPLFAPHLVSALMNDEQTTSRFNVLMALMLHVAWQQFWLSGFFTIPT